MGQQIMSVNFMPSDRHLRLLLTTSYQIFSSESYCKRQILLKYMSFQTAIIRLVFWTKTTTQRATSCSSNGLRIFNRTLCKDSDFHTIGSADIRMSQSTKEQMSWQMMERTRPSL